MIGGGQSLKSPSHSVLQAPPVINLLKACCRPQCQCQRQRVWHQPLQALPLCTRSWPRRPRREGLGLRPRPRPTRHRGPTLSCGSRCTGPRRDARRPTVTAAPWARQPRRPRASCASNNVLAGGRGPRRDAHGPTAPQTPARPARTLHQTPLGQFRARAPTANPSKYNGPRRGARAPTATAATSPPSS